jgi:hypothetical protein
MVFGKDSAPVRMLAAAWIGIEWTPHWRNRLFVPNFIVYHPQVFPRSLPDIFCGIGNYLQLAIKGNLVPASGRDSSVR